MATNPYASEDENVRAMYLPMIDPAVWQGATVPDREWAWDHWIPWNQATYLTGPGSAGKSLFAQQLATAVGLGLPFMGVDTRQATALYITCEDDPDELHRRQAAICNAMGVPLSDLSGRVYLASLVGKTDCSLFAPGEEGKLETTTTFGKLMTTIRHGGAQFIVLDNVAHLFAGNENDRHHVAGFVSLMNRIAIMARGAVLFIGHPNKAGNDYSGSTAWENQVRSRLFLTRPTDDDGNVLDQDARVLSRGKANYARNGETIAFRWHDWAFVQESDLPQDQRAEIAANAKASTENIAFMRCLKAATERKLAVSHNTGTNYYASTFADMREAKGMKKEGFKRAFNRLLAMGEIELDKQLWQRDNRAWKYGIKAVEKCTDRPHRPAAPTDPQVIDIACTDPHAPTAVYTTYINGAPPLGGGHLSDDDLDWGDEEADE